MLFNSIDFAVFLPIVFLLYWIVLGKSIKGQNGLIVLASFVFYGWWDWRFLFLVAFSTLVDYFIGIGLSQTTEKIKRKRLLWLSIFVNLGFLGFFKYFNFFITSFTEAFTFFGQEIQPNTLNIILPVGISFYTFQTMSYTIDVYRGHLKPTKDLISFTAFVSFFPQLVAGPIERATNLLPQFYKNRTFDYAKSVDGLRQILWGLFKKVVIADSCAEYANFIFDNYQSNGSLVLVLGAVFFAFQIYGDFSGYSDIAIGTSRLFGFELMRNFSFPYFSRDIAEFWRRWHISLSTWLRDYVYIPLGGSHGGTWMKIRNTFIIFIVSGFWHGANWTFIIWGALNAFYFLPLLLTNNNRKNIEIVDVDRSFPSLKNLYLMLFTFSLSVFAWIFFRAETVTHAFDYIHHIVSLKLIFQWHIDNSLAYLVVILLVLFFVVIEWMGRRDAYAIEKLGLAKSKFFRWTFYSFLIFLMGMYMQTEETPFIYFQF